MKAAAVATHLDGMLQLQ